MEPPQTRYLERMPVVEEGEVEEGEGNDEDEGMEDQEDEIETMQQESAASEQGQQNTDNQERLTAITPPVPMRVSAFYCLEDVHL